MLHFKHKSLTFKDSLSFLNIPVANFPKTFGLTELKKGFFPHKFSTLENLQYEGTILDLKYYEPEHMTEDKKNECEEWHAEQVSNGESLNFQREMLEYCKSDVQLSREGCLKSAQGTMQHAGFNPLTQCITIASTTYYYWRNYRMKPKPIAVEPAHGWGELKTNQSKIALEWLCVQDQQLGGHCIKHTRNVGEQMIQIKRGKVKVDGYYPITKTVYEFYGCEYHGWRKCKAKQSSVQNLSPPRSNSRRHISSNPNQNRPAGKSRLHSDRNVRMRFQETFEAERGTTCCGEQHDLGFPIGSKRSVLCRTNRNGEMSL